MPKPKIRRASGGCFAAWMALIDVLRRLLAHALQREQLLGGKGIEIGGIGDEMRLHQLIDERGADALDIQRAARDEMLDALLALRRAGDAAAARHRFTFRLHHLRPAHRAVSGEVEWPFLTATRLGEHAHHLGDDFPGLLDNTLSPMRISLRRISSSLCSVARLTTEPASSTGSIIATGVSAPVRPTCTINIADGGFRLLRRIFIGDGPARAARDEAQAALLLQRVHLHHHAVDIIAQGVARLFPMAQKASTSSAPCASR